jgi:excisionase family DNA binding protein
VAEHAPAVEPFITPDEAAEILGKGVDWIYRMCARDEIPSYKIGVSRRLRASELEEWAQRQASGNMGTVTSLEERRR